MFPRLPFIAAALVAIASAASGPARATTLGPEGGSDGMAFLDACPVGEYLVGVSASRWELIDAIQPLCASDQGIQFGVPALRGTTHGSGAAIVQLACPREDGIRSLAMDFVRNDAGVPTFVSDLSLPCETFTAGAAPTAPDYTTVCLDAGQACQPLKAKADASEQCPPGEIATGIIGRASQSLTALGLICGPAPARVGPSAQVATAGPTTVPPALPPVAALPPAGPTPPVVPPAIPPVAALPPAGATPPFVPPPTPPGGALPPSAGPTPPVASPPTVPALPPGSNPLQTGPAIASVGPNNIPPAVPPGPSPSSPIPPTAVQPAVAADLVACIGGAGMTSVTGGDGTTRILFMPVAGGSGAALQRGQCGWSDHSPHPGAPFVLLFPPGVIPTIPVQAASNGLPFQVHAHDDGKGSLVVTSIDTPTPVNPFASGPQVTPIDPFAARASSPQGGPAVAAVPTQAVVTQAVNVRSGPGTTNATLGLLQQGAVVQVDHCADGWCQLTQPIAQKTAWVLQQYLRFGTPLPAAGGPSG